MYTALIPHPGENVTKPICAARRSGASASTRSISPSTRSTPWDRYRSHG
jgi:hypothetical protein